MSTHSSYLPDWRKVLVFWDAYYSAPYTVHRSFGLVSVPLIPSDLQGFRPWMAAIHLAKPVRSWWDVPAQAGENFGKLLDYIKSGRKVVDLQAYMAMERSDEQINGYVPGAVKRAQEMAHPAVKSLSELRYLDVGVRRRATWALMIQGANAITELLEAVNYEDEAIRWFALEAIGKNARGGSADEKDLALVAEKFIIDEDEYVRQAALDLLSECGEFGIGRLLQLTSAEKTRRYWEALWTLVYWVKAQGAAGIEMLAKFAHSSDTKMQNAALSAMGKAGYFLAPKLAELLCDNDENIRIGALSALLELGDGAVSFLGKAVGDGKEPACTIAQRALDGLGRVRVDELLRTTIPLPVVARLMAIGGELALSTFSGQLRSVDKRVRFMAARGLVYLGQVSVPIFIDSLSSPDVNLRRRACEALRDIAPPEARDVLKKALTDLDVKVRQNAVRALAHIGNPDDLSTIRPLLLDQSRPVRRTVKEAFRGSRFWPGCSENVHQSRAC
jgi:HEAT repeat protein